MAKTKAAVKVKAEDVKVKAAKKDAKKAVTAGTVPAKVKKAKKAVADVTPVKVKKAKVSVSGPAPAKAAKKTKKK